MYVSHSCHVRYFSRTQQKVLGTVVVYLYMLY